MSEQSEISRPADQPQARPDTVIAPKSQPVSETLTGVAGGFAEAGDDAKLAPEAEHLAKSEIRDRYPEIKRAEYQQVIDERTKAGKSSRLAELLMGFHTDFYKSHNIDENKYTAEEDFYLHNSWKAYLKEYGEQSSYSLEEIAATEKLTPGQIKDAIEDGAVKDPQAIRLYGQAELDYTRKFWLQLIEKYSSDPELQPELERTKQNAARDIARAERECLPLIKRDEKAMLDFCHQEAEGKLQIADWIARGILDDPSLSQAAYYSAASSWFELAAQIILHGLPTQTEQQVEEQRQPPLLPLGKDQQQSTETENLYEEMTSYFMLDLLLEGKLPVEAVPLYFQKRKDEKIAVATGALYKRIGFSIPDTKIQRKFEAIVNAQHAKILAKDYNDPQKIARDVARIEAKYSRLQNNPVEQARYFANEASDLASYLSSNHTWMNQEKIDHANTSVANLYGLASRLARSRNGSPQQLEAGAKITAEKAA